MVERVLVRDFGRVPVRFQTIKKNNGPNICSKAKILEKFYMHDIDLHILFIDFKKTFDSKNQKSFWNHQRILGYPRR
jgi:hypothetical protein